MKTFENYLQEKHFNNYHGTDDDMSDAFDKWLTELQADDFIKYGDEYADWKIKECLPERDTNEIRGYPISVVEFDNGIMLEGKPITTLGELEKYKGYCCHGRTNAYDCPHCLKYN